MNTTLLIAADSIRGLLRQRLLLGLMAAAIALIAIFSVVLISQRKLVTMTVIDESEANAASDETPAAAAGAATPAAEPAPPAGKAAVVRARAKARRDESSLSKEDKQKLAEQMDQMASMFQAAFYQAASFGGSLVALFIFSTAVSTEIRKGTIRITLTKPVSRTQFILGKYLGGIAVMAGYALIASGAIVLFAKFGEMQLSPAMKFAPWLMFCRQLMLGSLAMLLSLFVHPFLGAVLAFFAGNGLYGKLNPLYYVLPSYSAFNVFGQMLQGTLVSGHDIVLLSLYAVDFVVLMLVLALWRFRTKELV